MLATLRFLRNAPQGPQATGVGGLQGVLLPLPRHEDRRARRRQRALHRRHRDPPRRRAVLPVVLRPAGAGGSRDPQARRRDLSPRRLALGAAERAGHQPRLVARRRLHRVRLARLQRGDAGLPARARLADLSGRARGVDRVDQHLRRELAHVLRAAVPELLAAVRPPVHARVDGLPRDPGRLHAPPRPRLLREQPARDLRAARLRDHQSGAAARTTAPTSGASPRATARATSSSRTPAASGAIARYYARGAGVGRTRTTTARWRRPRRRRRFRSRRSWRFPPCSRCTRASASTSTPNTASSTRSTRRSTSTSRCAAAAASRASAGSPATISASIRARSSR